MAMAEEGIPVRPVCTDSAETPLSPPSECIAIATVSATVMMMSMLLEFEYVPPSWRHVLILHRHLLPCYCAVVDSVVSLFVVALVSLFISLSLLNKGGAQNHEVLSRCYSRFCCAVHCERPLVWIQHQCAALALLLKLKNIYVIYNFLFYIIVH
jgi:hypothetical protein